MKRLLINLGFSKTTIWFRKFIFWVLSLNLWKEPFILLGEGTQRRVYKHKDFVIKVPLDWDGLMSNDKEARTYRSAVDGWLLGIKHARCKLHHNGLLIMEYVEPAYGRSLPIWTCYVDCQQVGYNSKEQLVAYDYGF